MIGPILLVATAAGLVAAGIAVSGKQQAAGDLQIVPNGIELNPLKNIKNLRLNIPINLSIRNIHGTSLNLQAIDLAITINGKTLATIIDYNAVKIQGVGTTNHRVVASTGLANMINVLGGEVLRMIGEVKAGNGTLRDALPKEAKIVGKIRAEGLVFDIDSTYPIVTDSKPGGTKK